MNNFIYETPTKVYFGKDEELKVGKIIAEFHPKSEMYQDFLCRVSSKESPGTFRWKFSKKEWTA